MTNGAPFTPAQSGPRTHAPQWLRSILVGIERASVLDPIRDKMAAVSSPLLANPKVTSWLRGEPLGHAAHPLLTDYPIGAWTSAAVLDLVPARRFRPAATLLIAAGLAGVAPTVATGIAEWHASDVPSQRVGVVHAAANSLATTLYVGSLVSRLLGGHRTGVTLGYAGFGTAMLGGYLGSHLSIVRKVGTADPLMLSENQPPS